MDCRELEQRLEALLDGRLDEVERRRCARHLESCPRCRELTEPFATEVTPPEDLIGSVLASTSGSPCGRAEDLLCAWLDGETSGADHELMRGHLASCDGCRALAAALTRLSAELPRLAELRPDAGFVDAVMAATLPLHVRLRRWWAVAWPSWVQRPRFASEAAFIATMVVVLVVATPGSPLEAVPTRALELATTDPTSRLEAPVAALGEEFDTHVKQPLGARYSRGESEVRAWLKAGELRGRATFDEVAVWIGTSRERLASLLASADDKASENENTASQPNQEKP